MAWATIDDLVLLFPYAQSESEDRLQLVLDSAEGLIRATLEDAGVDYENPSETLEGNLRTVTLWVSGRALQSGTPTFGANSWSQTAGPVSQSVSWEAGIGNLYLTSTELRMLGASSSGRGAQLFLSKDVLGGDGDA